jgi:hypothetical protein
MQSISPVICDGCGQRASADHIASRLKRLENMTRYRPVHVQTLLLAPASPADEREYLYCATGDFQGESATILKALGVQTQDRSVEETLAAFQRSGYLLAYVLECSIENLAARTAALESRLPNMLARIRRSYKPKRIVVVGQELMGSVTQITAAGLGAAVILQGGRPCEWPGLSSELLKEAASAP